MVHKIKKDHFFVYAVLFSIFTISYAKITNNYNSWNYIKYISIIGLVLLGLKNKDRKTVYLKKDFMILTLFLISTVLSCVTQDLSIGSIVMALSYVFVLILYEVWGNYLYKEPRIMLSCAFGIICTVIIVLGMSRNEIAYQLIYGIEGRKRLFGKFSHANIMASMLMSAVLFLDIARRFENSRRIRKIEAVLILISIALIVLSNSRTTMIVLVVYYGYIFCKTIQEKMEQKSNVIFVASVIIIGSICSYLFITEYVLLQKTFYMRMDDYLKISLHGIEWIFGHSFSSSVAGGSFEFAPYTIINRMGIGGAICYILLFLKMWQSSRGLVGTRKMLLQACVIGFFISLLGEAYVVNITHVFSFTMYTLIGILGNRDILLEEE